MIATYCPHWGCMEEHGDRKWLDRHFDVMSLMERKQSQVFPDFYRLVSRSRDSGENAHKWYREHAQAELPWSPGASDGADSTGDPLARLAAKVIIYMYI